MRIRSVSVIAFLVGCSGSEPDELGVIEQLSTFPADTAWNTVVQADPTGDGGNNGRDIVGDATRPACQVYTNGIDFFARMRLNDSPAQAQSVSPFGWSMIIDTDGNTASYEYMISIEGIGTSEIHFLKNTSVTGGLADVADTDLSNAQPPDPPASGTPYLVSTANGGNTRITAITTDTFSCTGDDDGDGVGDELDNCIETANVDQLDTERSTTVPPPATPRRSTPITTAKATRAMPTTTAMACSTRSITARR